MEVAERVPAETRAPQQAQGNLSGSCCSSDVLLLRCTSEMKLDVGEHVSFCLSSGGTMCSC